MTRRFWVSVALLVLGWATSASAATFDGATPNSGSAPAFGAPPNKWSVYPMPIPVSGLTGTVGKASVTIRGWTTSTDASYTDILLQSPAGTFVKVVSDAFAPSGTQSMSNTTVVFDQDAEAAAPQTGSQPTGATVRFRPADYTTYVDNFPDLPSAANTAPADLGRVVGEDPNGTWRLYLAIAGAGGQQSASIAGWSLDLALTPPPAPPAGSPTPTATAPTPVASVPPTAPPDRSAPVVSRVAVAGGSFHPAAHGGAVGTTGASIGFRLSEAAGVAFDVDKLVAGRRSGGTCRAGRKRGARCTKAVPVPGDFAFAGKAGTNVLRFTGRVGGRALSPGRYRITGVATDAAGNAAKPFTVTVTILRRR